MLADTLARMHAHIERGFEKTGTKFAVLADDNANIMHEMRKKATKHQIVSRDRDAAAQHTKIHFRVADLEEKVFGRARD
jgi:hypothetical protein